MKECQEEAADRSQCPGTREAEWSIRKRLQTEVSDRGDNTSTNPQTGLRKGKESTTDRLI